MPNNLPIIYPNPIIPDPNTIPFIGADIETPLMGPKAPYPRPICLTTSEPNSNRPSQYGAIYAGRDQILQSLRYCFDNYVLVGHNFAGYDVPCILCEYPELQLPVLKAFLEGRIKDTLIREGFLNVAETGETDGTASRADKALSLAYLVKVYLGKDISAGKEEGSWRTNFELLEGVPLEEWPVEASEYAIDDACEVMPVYWAQEQRRQRIRDKTGYDVIPPDFENKRTLYSFALSMITAAGMPVHPNIYQEIQKRIDIDMEVSNFPNLVNNGFLLDAIPPMPYANGAKDHQIDCVGHKDNPDYKKSKSVKDCNCPPKMKKAVGKKKKEGLFREYVVQIAETNPDIELKYEFDPKTQENKLKVDKDWCRDNAPFDINVSEWARYKSDEKIQTAFLPNLRMATESLENQNIIRIPFFSIKKTSRTSSSKSKNYPSCNGQQVDPRVRKCFVAPRNVGMTTEMQWVSDPGAIMAMVSTDYRAMELGTWAQCCIDLNLGRDCADLINADKDCHHKLGAMLAYEFDPEFKQWAGNSDVYTAFNYFKKEGKNIACSFKEFNRIWDIFYREKKKGRDPLYGDYFKHYRTFAKPVGLGCPGGQGPKTMSGIAHATYGINITVEQAASGREVWKDCYSEAGPYLKYINKSAVDPSRDEGWVSENGRRKRKCRYFYRLKNGFYRANCSYTAAANGMGLQSPSASGALDGVTQVVAGSIMTGLDELLGPDERGLLRNIPVNFIHDEMLNLMVVDSIENVNQRIKRIEELMVLGMQEVTPDVKAGVESAMMFSWDKYAGEKLDEVGNLIPYDIEEPYWNKFGDIWI